MEQDNKQSESIESIAKHYLAMVLMYKETYDDLDRVDKGIIKSAEIFKELLKWVGYDG